LRLPSTKNLKRLPPYEIESSHTHHIAPCLRIAHPPRPRQPHPEHAEEAQENPLPASLHLWRRHHHHVVRLRHRGKRHRPPQRRRREQNIRIRKQQILARRVPRPHLQRKRLAQPTLRQVVDVNRAKAL